MPMPDGTSINAYRGRMDYYIGQALAGLCAHHGTNAQGVSDRDIARAAIAIAKEVMNMVQPQPEVGECSYHENKLHPKMSTCRDFRPAPAGSSLETNNPRVK
jgi:hypothetical protein